ncbi:hypothetical protein ACWDA7_35345 [Streptomyces sp. NPDC001156]
MDWYSVYAPNDRLADIIHARVPDLDRAAAHELASATIVLIAGLWPFAHPGPTSSRPWRIPRSSPLTSTFPPVTAA